jgi:hypothetical protein
MILFANLLRRERIQHDTELHLQVHGGLRRIEQWMSLYDDVLANTAVYSFLHL